MMYGKVLIGGATASLGPGDRIILDGPNGCGKSTLLKTLAKKEQPFLGRIDYAPQIVIGHLAQEPHFENPTETVLGYLQNKFSIAESKLRSHLHQIGLLEGRYIGQQLGRLSVGQQRRLQLLELILADANILLLDEPTNHLAPHVIDQLEEALLTFRGGVIAATHDRRFAERIGTAALTWVKE